MDLGNEAGFLSRKSIRFRQVSRLGKVFLKKSYFAEGF